MIISIFAVLGGTVLGFSLYMLSRSKVRWLSKLSRGAEYFMLGFVKIFAVTMPVYDILKTIIENIGMGFGIFAIIEFVLLINIGVYSAFSGYSDMACGVSLIWGLELPKNFARPFTQSSPFDFVKGFMSTLYAYL